MDIITKCLTDPKISWKAKGIFVYLTDNPAINFNELLSISKDKRTAIQTGLQELRMHGYLERFAIRDELGRFDFYLNIPKGYKLSEEEVLTMTNKELLAYYHKTKKEFPVTYNTILSNVNNELRKRDINVKDTTMSQILMDKK